MRTRPGGGEERVQKNLKNRDHREAEFLVVSDVIVAWRVDDVCGREV